jgi:hypothetical protein
VSRDLPVSFPYMFVVSIFCVSWEGHRGAPFATQKCAKRGKLK